MKEINIRPMEKMLRGLNLTADTVGGTLGPKGRNVYIDDAVQPEITNDGTTIATSIVLPDNVENIGAKVVKNACGQTNDDAGDGTTTTAVLLQAIVQECLKRPENPMVVRESLNEASKKALISLKKGAKKIDKVDQVAFISAENRKISDSISKIIDKIGKEAVITVEDSQTPDIHFDVVSGYEANVGFMSPYFANEPGRARCVMTDVPVFVTEKKIASIIDINPVFEQFQKAGITSAVIVCDDIDDSLLGVFVRNYVASKTMGTFKALVIRATHDLLKDIEAVVGATRVGDTTGVTFQMVDINKHLGKVKKIVSDASKTLFIPEDTTSAILWANHLQKFYNEEPNMYVKEKLLKRISQLKGGIAVLKIGAATDFERVYLKRKAEDAVKAVKAALEEGIVEGGGMALWRIASELKAKTIGEEILKRALTAPLRKIIENAGKDYAEVIRDMPDGFGYDAKWNEYIPLIENGIIDPAKVERCALENSVSAAGTFITTFTTITEYVKPEDNK